VVVDVRPSELVHHAGRDQRGGLEDGMMIFEIFFIVAEDGVAGSGMD
jgi:hypothetical protein